MKITLRFSIILLLVLSAMAQAASPQVQVKKSVLAKSADGFTYWPHAALNTDTGETLAIWQGPGKQIVFGKIIRSTGGSTKQEIPVIKGFAGQGSGVAYNPVTHEYLLVYNLGDLNPSDGIYGLRLDSHLKAIGKQFEIYPGTDATRSMNPRVIFNAKTSGYTVLWERWDRGISGSRLSRHKTTPSPDAGISAIQLDGSGKITGNVVMIAKNPGKSDYYDDFCCGRILDVAMLPTGKKLLVLFQQRNAIDRVDYYLARVDLLLQKIKVKKFASYEIPANVHPNYPSRGASLAILPDGSAVVFYGDNDGIRRRATNSKGKLIGKDSVAFPSPLDVYVSDPHAVFSTIGNTTAGVLSTFQASADGTTTFTAHVLDSKGFPIGEPVSMYQYVLDVNGYPVPWGSAVAALPVKTLDTNFGFIFLQALALPDNKGNLIKVNVDVQP